MPYKIPANVFYHQHLCCIFGMFPAQAHLVNSSNQMVLLLVPTLSYDWEPWKQAQVQTSYGVSSTKNVCLWDSGSWARPLIGCVSLTSHLTLNLSISMSLLI